VDAYAERRAKLVNDNFEVNLKIVFTALNEIGKTFPFKDKIAHLQVERILAHIVKEYNDS
jgi:hypothetical protein